MATTTTKKKTTKKPTVETVSKEFSVKVNVASLNIRKGAGKNFAVVGCISDGGTYAIINESKGKDSVNGWGELKNGKGWISLDYCTRV